jgi:ATP-binding cassette subfamily B protein
MANISMTLARMNESVLFFRQYARLLALEEPLKISSAPRPVPPLTRGLTLRNVSFRYNEHHPWAIRNVNLFLPAHECLALVGLNGAGKTTLVKLITRLYDPTEGQILWDDIDIREFDPEAYRAHLGAIFQDFVHYDLTAQENIGLGDVSSIDDLSAIKDAAIKAGIHQRIETLPQGYESSLSRWLARRHEGVDLSGGEWQKIALARLFMRKGHELLMLDEPTAALDAQAEYELYSQFKSLMQNHTCILITHRFSTARMADRIAVLEQGTIVEYGTHAELLERQGSYAQLYQIQAASYQ